MTRIGYASGAFDLFHIGHLNILKNAKSRCDFLIAGVVSDEILRIYKGATPVIPLAERLEIVRNVRCVDEAVEAQVNDKLAIWRDLRFRRFLQGRRLARHRKGRPS
jgi:glycerol-3-phosphate cytidylyltransferase